MRVFVLLIALATTLAAPALIAPARAGDDIAAAQDVIRSQE